MKQEITMGSLFSGTGGNNVPIVLEDHPQDCRVTIAEDGNVPTLTSRMGTGGGQCANDNE